VVLFVDVHVIVGEHCLTFFSFQFQYKKTRIMHFILFRSVPFRFGKFRYVSFRFFPFRFVLVNFVTFHFAPFRFGIFRFAFHFAFYRYPT
jgi:hypothetical protein